MGPAPQTQTPGEQNRAGRADRKRRAATGSSGRVFQDGLEAALLCLQSAVFSPQAERGRQAFLPVLCDDLRTPAQSLTLRPSSCLHAPGVCSSQTRTHFDADNQSSTSGGKPQVPQRVWKSPPRGGECGLPERQLENVSTSVHTPDPAHQPLPVCCPDLCV